jgi:hypothetical protein
VIGKAVNSLQEVLNIAGKPGNALGNDQIYFARLFDTM